MSVESVTLQGSFLPQGLVALDTVALAVAFKNHGSPRCPRAFTQCLAARRDPEQDVMESSLALLKEGGARGLSPS